MVSRERILDAAARLYAKHGFKGATTRLIATEAGVNEVTLFRTFGSKSCLLEAVLLRHVSEQVPPTLPDAPEDPWAEVHAFIEASLLKMSELRPLLLHTMSEIDDRPEAQEFACRGRQQVHDTITSYIRQLQARGLAAADTDVDAAALMLTGTVIADIMGRAVVPGLYPPLAQMADRYTTLFLRAIGARATPPTAQNDRAAVTETSRRFRCVRSTSRKSPPPSDITT